MAVNIKQYTSASSIGKYIGDNTIEIAPIDEYSYLHRDIYSSSYDNSYNSQRNNQNVCLYCFDKKYNTFHFLKRCNLFTFDREWYNIRYITYRLEEENHMGIKRTYRLIYCRGVFSHEYIGGNDYA
jgi:hypothetical protein